MKLLLFITSVIVGITLIFYGAHLQDPFNLDLNYWQYAGLCFIGFSFILWVDRD